MHCHCEHRYTLETAAKIGLEVSHFTYSIDRREHPLYTVSLVCQYCRGETDYIVGSQSVHINLLPELKNKPGSGYGRLVWVDRLWNTITQQ